MESYIINHDNLPINDYEKSQQHWERKADPSKLLFCDLGDMPTTIRVERDPTTGQLLGYSEVSSSNAVVKGHVVDSSVIPDLLNEAKDLDVGLEMGKLSCLVVRVSPNSTLE